MSSNNKTMGLILTVVGLLVAIIGAVVLLLDSIDIKDLYAYIIIAVGVIILIAGVACMYLLGGSGSAQKEKKAKAPAAAKPAAASKASGKSRAASVNLGDSDLAKAIKYAAAKIDSKVADGKMTDAEGDAYMARVMAYSEQVGKDEDAAMVGLSQLMGAIAKA